jgi:hypothetical protein
MQEKPMSHVARRTDRRRRGRGSPADRDEIRHRGAAVSKHLVTARDQVLRDRKSDLPESDHVDCH